MLMLRSTVFAAKWNAWKKLGSLSKEDAQKRYCAAVSKTDPKWRESINAKL